MSVGQNPPFFLDASYSMATSGTATTQPISVTDASIAVVTNLSTATIYVVFSANGSVATVGAGYVILPNAQRMISFSKDMVSWSCIASTATAGTAYLELGSAR